MKKLLFVVLAAAAAAAAAGVVSAADSTSVAPVVLDTRIDPNEPSNDYGPGWYRLPNGDIYVYGNYVSNSDDWITIWLPVQIGECKQAGQSESGRPIECYNNAVRVNRSDTTDGTFDAYWWAIGSGVGGTNFSTYVPPRAPCGEGTKYYCP